MPFTHGIVVFGETGVYAEDSPKHLERVFVAILRHQKLGALRKEAETDDADQRWHSAEGQENPPGIVHESTVPNGK
jgi:hypothetical protein